MNIFVVDRQPAEAAKALCDKHIVKMIVESAQMLCTAHRTFNKDAPSHFYKATHNNHPCTQWVMESTGNYDWLYLHFSALCREYTHRYGKVHLTERKLHDDLEAPPKEIPVGDYTKPPLAMPDEYKRDDEIEAYREYYRNKEIKMRWTKREQPKWLKEAK